MKTMNELKDFIIAERIEMLIQEQKKTLPKKTEEEIEIAIKGEEYLGSLDVDTRQIIIDYIDLMDNGGARKQTYLYTQGFCDGVKLVNGLHRLNKIE